MCLIDFPQIALTRHVEQEPKTSIQCDFPSSESGYDHDTNRSGPLCINITALLLELVEGHFKRNKYPGLQATLYFQL